MLSGVASDLPHVLRYYLAAEDEHTVVFIGHALALLRIIQL